MYRRAAGLAQAARRGLLAAAAPRSAAGPVVPQRASQFGAVFSRSCQVAAGGSGSAAGERKRNDDVIWSLRHIADEMPAALRQAYSRQNMSQPELNQLELQESIRRWQRFEGDTGSSAVQVAVFTAQIEKLARHQEMHHKDKNCKRRLQMLVHKRAKMLKYLRRTELGVYEQVIAAYKIRPNPLFDPTMPKRFPAPTNRTFKGKRGLLPKLGTKMRPMTFKTLK